MNASGILKRIDVLKRLFLPVFCYLGNDTQYKNQHRRDRIRKTEAVHRNLQMGIRKLRYCKDCKRKFTPVNQKPAEQQATEDFQENQSEQPTEPEIVL